VLAIELGNAARFCPIELPAIAILNKKSVNFFIIF
jgi:hypothetical protein